MNKRVRFTGDNYKRATLKPQPISDEVYAVITATVAVVLVVGGVIALLIVR